MEIETLGLLPLYSLDWIDTESSSSVPSIDLEMGNVADERVILFLANSSNDNLR